MNRFCLHFVLIVLIFSSCHSSWYFRPERPDDDMITALENQNHRYFASQGLMLCMYGGSDIGPLREIAAGYRTKRYQFATIEEARRFFCPFVERFIKPFNENKEVRPYLRHYPMIAENFNLEVSFADSKNQSLVIPYICTIMLIRGEIRYFTDDPKQILSKQFIRLHSETFEEAQKILEMEKAS